MTHSLPFTLRHSSSVLLLSIGLFLSGLTPAAAQSVESVVENMRAQYEQRLETVDTYIVETNLYTSYNRKVVKDGMPTYETQTRMKGQETTPFTSTATPSSAYGFQFDRLIQRATYAGTETIDGRQCHVLQVDDPSMVDPDMADDAASMTYYVDANRHLPVRMVMKTKKAQQEGPQASSVTINLKNYETTDGLTLPHRMEMQFEMAMSEQQRQQMKHAMQQMENMSDAQRKQMQNMMGEQMEMMKQMMSGDPVIIDVQNVKVNTEIPDDIF